MIGTARARQEMNAGARLWMEVETRMISLTPAFDGRVWMASVDVMGERHNAKRAIRSISAQGPTSMDAVERLVAKLEALAVDE